MSQYIQLGYYMYCINYLQMKYSCVVCCTILKHSLNEPRSSKRLGAFGDNKQKRKPNLVLHYPAVIFFFSQAKSGIYHKQVQYL